MSGLAATEAENRTERMMNSTLEWENGLRFLFLASDAAPVAPVARGPAHH